MLRFPLQPMWDLTIHPLGDPMSSLSHCPMSTPQGEERGFHTLIKNVSFPSPAIVGSHNLGGLTSSLSHRPTSTPQGEERGFHTLIKNASFSSPAIVGSHNLGGLTSSLSHRLNSPPQGEERGFHILIKKCFVPLSNRCEISKSTPLRTNVLTSTPPGIHSTRRNIG